jgi:hypothetical protein
MEYIERELGHGCKRHVCLDRISVKGNRFTAVIFVSSIGGASMKLYTDVEFIDTPLGTPRGITEAGYLLWDVYPIDSNPKNNIDQCIRIIRFCLQQLVY